MERTNVINSLQELSFEEIIQIVCFVLVGILLMFVLVWRRNHIKDKANNSLQRYLDKQLTSEQELLADSINS